MDDIRYHADLKVNYSSSFDPLAIQDTIDNINRPKKSTTTDPYLGAGPYVDEEDWEAGLCVAGGLGKLHFEEGICEAEVKLPSASVGVGVDGKALKAKAYAKAELCSVSTTVGPAKGKLGLAVDTGAEIGPTGVGFQVLGTGLSVGRRTGVSLFGSEISIRLW